MSYKGKSTTTGTSEAIRIDKALFKQHPEFRQQAEVRADIIGPGNLGRGEPPRFYRRAAKTIGRLALTQD
ncbi:MAG TPA: hypothetical protein V6C97_15340 [Oculatellaceae cyanobacterium]